MLDYSKLNNKQQVAVERKYKSGVSGAHPATIEALVKRGWFMWDNQGACRLTPAGRAAYEAAQQPAAAQVAAALNLKPHDPEIIKAIRGGDEWDYRNGPSPANVQHLIDELEREPVDEYDDYCSRRIQAGHDPALYSEWLDIRLTWKTEYELSQQERGTLARENVVLRDLVLMVAMTKRYSIGEGRFRLAFSTVELAAIDHAATEMNKVK